MYVKERTLIRGSAAVRRLDPNGTLAIRISAKTALGTSGLEIDHLQCNSGTRHRAVLHRRPSDSGFTV